METRWDAEQRYTRYNVKIDACTHGLVGLTLGISVAPQRAWKQEQE